MSKNKDYCKLSKRDSNKQRLRTKTLLTANCSLLIISLLTLFLLFAPCSLLFAIDTDFGLAVSQYAKIDGDNFEYRADILPRYTLFFGETGSFIVFGGLTLGVEDGFYFVPELLRTEFAIRFADLGLKAGRITYTDPLNFIADGLFDGFQLTYASSMGRFGLSGLYTGLLYKKNANITMTAHDAALYALPLDYGNFADTYFAPRRLLASLDWEHLAILEILCVKAAIIGQIDLNNSEEKLHTQYFILKTDIPVSNFVFELGGSLQTAQKKTAGESEFNLGFAGMLGANWNVPASFPSRLSFTVRYAGGEADGNIGAFAPVTNKYYGQIFQPRMTALTVLGLNYTARLSENLGASANAAYFIRGDTVTPNSYPISGEGEGKNLLGAEFFARLIWSPSSDLQLNLGGGAFVPALGNNWVNEPVKWRIELSAVLAIF